jgi:hypothetical protein
VSPDTEVRASGQLRSVRDGHPAGAYVTAAGPILFIAMVTVVSSFAS